MLSFRLTALALIGLLLGSSPAVSQTGAGSGYMGSTGLASDDGARDDEPSEHEPIEHKYNEEEYNYEGQPEGFSGSPAGAAALGAIFPGAGHFYLKQWNTGSALACLGGLELSALAYTMFDGWPSSRTDSDPTFLLASSWYQNTMFYSMYAAYRDARKLLHNEGYRYPAPEGELNELLLAPLDPEVMFKPEVGFGLVAMVGLGLLVSWLIEGNLSPNRHLFDGQKVNFMGRSMGSMEGFTLGEVYYAALFTPVGIGEEALFRGVLQSGLTEYMGPWGGLATSSLVFGAAHAPNALAFEDRKTRMRYLSAGVPFLTLLGGYMGWVYQHNHHSLAEPVALHFWYDFIMGTLSFLLDPDNQPFAVRLALPF